MGLRREVRTMIDRSKEDHLLENIPRDLLYHLLDSPTESLIIIDNDGRVLFMSTAYEQISSMTVSQAIGKHVTDISPTTRLHTVLKTGKAEIGEPFFLQGKVRIVARIPIKKDGQVIGAYGKLLFWHSDKIRDLYNQLKQLKGTIKNYQNRISQFYSSRYNVENIVGESFSLQKAKTQALQVANTDSTVLIRGESGTGKELFAHMIHHASRRSAFPFIGVNCSCIPYELAESELFGYEPGSFTGATKKGKKGKFELAENGTIFLDEIGDMPINIQGKLLRVLQEKQIEKIGGKPVTVDCRVIAATNRPLEEMMKEGKFRPDLYYRLNVAKIRLPSLKQMKSDIPLMVQHFIAKLKESIPKNISSISPEAMEALVNYSWPGNIRELENMLEGAIIFCTGNQIELEHLPQRITRNPNSTTDQQYFDSSLTLKEQMQLVEKQIIKKTLAMTGNDKTAAANLLNIHRSGLHKKIRQYGLV